MIPPGDVQSQRDTTRPAVITLPLSALSHPLQLRLVRKGMPDSPAIPIFVDPVLLR